MNIFILRTTTTTETGNSNLREGCAGIQVNAKRIRGKSFREVREVLAVENALSADDVEGDDAVRVLRCKQRDDGGLIQFCRHGRSVVAGAECEVVDEGLTDGCAVDGEVHCEVALKGWWLVGMGFGMGFLYVVTYHFEGHHAGVGDEERSVHVCSVGVRSSQDVDRSDVEAFQLVKGWCITLLAFCDI